ncbi:MAG: zf-HC2 domain-containing protein [Bryobacteraceae bacterium]|jgi:hypothetical protein
MSCPKFETEVALYAGGDLPEGRIVPVKAHLAECADCRALAEELRGLMGELRDEPFEEAMLAQVRHNVLAQLWGKPAARSGVVGRFGWKLALAAAAILAVVLLWPRPHAVRPRMARVAPAQATPIAPAPSARIVPVHHRVRRRRRAPAAQPGPPLLVQFVTDDPNIVIYWLVDQKPQGD